jgi:hypothetical protein
VTIGPDIKCFACGARPYPSLSLPEVVRSTFDLLKLVERKDAKTGEVRWWAPADVDEGLWFCERHRSALGDGRFSAMVKDVSE